MIADAAHAVHFIVPEGVDDPARVSGGNVYDLRLTDGLRQAGWDVRTTQVRDAPSTEVGAALAGMPAGSVVLVDGIVAAQAAAAIEAAGDRLRVVILAHMVAAAFGGADDRVVEDEQRALRAAHRVIVTSAWTRSEIIRRRLVPPDRVVLAAPGADGVTAAAGTRRGGALLCVGVVADHKGQDILIDALADLSDRTGWRCTIVGSLETDPVFAGDIAKRARQAGIGDRVMMTGVLTGQELDAAYRRTDLFVAPSRVESYGMAIADALRRGIPVVASRVGGIPLTVAPGRAAILVPPEPRALSEALGRWMADPSLRRRLKSEAVRGRTSLPTWKQAVERVADTLAGVG